MAQMEVFEKILHVREKEKDDAHREYKQAVDDFETAATELYHLLKEKEDLEDQLNQNMKRSMSVQEMNSYHQYITQLENKIIRIQSNVQKARKVMDQKHLVLNEAYIEMKKFEKVLDHKKEKFQEEIAKNEKNTMDDISVLQFIQKRNR
ncbi:flagellar FliJ protein [Melghiribacillus thermohalophilus]|uniref:Flagellar FliJ protein n=1 Tax=Melghiribacillus thermohalophilus TaxID=1324956 RepID=A0A4V2V2W3_9BACI|nr:flagellar export protein FliJ [Melghiribacillus thermohalophilus]TCT26771.1 flagellar FliJ protein [Melghiribacillus thermohalophilus]